MEHDALEKNVAPSHQQHSALVQSAPPPAPPCHLLEIAPELRNRIWEYALIDSDPIMVHHGMREPGLLRTCKQIRQETVKLYYHSNIFDLEVWDCDVKLVEAFRARLRKYLRPTQFQVRLGFCGNPNWPNLKAWCRRVHSGRSGHSIADDTATGYESAIIGALAIALSCKKQPWQLCETALVSYRRVIGHIDRRWLNG